MAEIEWVHHLEEAQAAAKRLRRLLFVDVYSPTCYGCAKMKVETFPNPQVVTFLNDNFVCLKLNSKIDLADIGKIVAPYKLSWMPLFIFRDWRLTEVRRSSGYLSPSDLIAESMFSLGMVDLVYTHYDRAGNWFARIVADYPQKAIAPEALYWAGISAYLGNDDLDALGRQWESLAAQYPDSVWRHRADILAFDPVDIFGVYPSRES